MNRSRPCPCKPKPSSSPARRGIGLAIALRAARDGANIAIAAKTGEPNPKLPARSIRPRKRSRKAGGKALPILCDIRFEEQVQAAVDATAARFGGIDICVNNASAISLTGTLATDMKRYDLMNQINARGTFLTSRCCIPHLKRAANPHVLMLSPPLDMSAKWFRGHTAYTMAKFGMSMCVLGMSAEFADEGHRLQRAVAAHRHRHRRDPQRARRRRRHEALPARRRSSPTRRT